MAKWDVENVHYLETRNRRHPEDGFVETRKWVLYWKLLPNYHQGKQGIEPDFSPYQAMDIIRGSDFQTVLTNS